MKAVIYARQSIDKKADSLAVTRQLDECRNLAVQRRWTLVGEYVDNDRSASTGRRPEYQRLLADLDSGKFGVVITWQVDRLVRRLVDLEDVIERCERAGVRVATVSGDIDLSTAAGRLNGRILASVARQEVERKGERQVSANRQRATRGDVGFTRRPYGYDRTPDGKYVTVKDEAAQLRAAARAVLKGATMASIVADLNERGARTSTGASWTVTTLRRLLLSPRHAGRAVYRGDDHGKGRWPAIFTADTHDRLVATLTDPRRRTAPSTTTKYLLSGLALCGRCGAPLFATPMGVKGRERMVYRCRTTHLARSLLDVDDVVRSVVLARLSAPDAAAIFSADVDVVAMQSELVELKDRRDGLAALLSEGLLSAPAVREQSTKLTERISRLEAAVAEATGTGPVARLVDARNTRRAWDALTVLGQRQVIRELMTVTVLPVGKGTRDFNPESVRIEWRSSEQ